MRREHEFELFLKNNYSHSTAKHYLEYCHLIEKIVDGDMEDIVIKYSDSTKIEGVLNKYYKSSSVVELKKGFNAYLKFRNGCGLLAGPKMAIVKKKKNKVPLPSVFKGEEQVPYTPPKQGLDKNRQLVYYHQNVPVDQRVENLCHQLECEYLELVYNFAREIFVDSFEQAFPWPIKVLLCKECPSRIYQNSDAYVAKKINELVEKHQMVTSDDVSRILRFEERVAGIFSDKPEPHIEIYFNQYYLESETPEDRWDEYISKIAKTLAHEFAHYLEYEYCKRHGTKHYQDARVSEAIADFFGVLFSIYRSQSAKKVFDMYVAEKRYNTWKEREGSGWPYAYALYFLNKPYKDKFPEYSKTEMDASRDKLRRVFAATIDPEDAFKKLEN